MVSDREWRRPHWKDTGAIRLHCASSSELISSPGHKFAHCCSCCGRIYPLNLHKKITYWLSRHDWSLTMSTNYPYASCIQVSRLPVVDPWAWYSCSCRWRTWSNNIGSQKAKKNQARHSRSLRTVVVLTLADQSFYYSSTRQNVDEHRICDFVLARFHYCSPRA